MVNVKSYESDAPESTHVLWKQFIVLLIASSEAYDRSQEYVPFPEPLPLLGKALRLQSVGAGRQGQVRSRTSGMRSTKQTIAC